MDSKASLWQLHLTSWDQGKPYTEYFFLYDEAKRDRKGSIVDKNTSFHTSFCLPVIKLKKRLVSKITAFCIE